MGPRHTGQREGRNGSHSCRAYSEMGEILISLGLGGRQRAPKQTQSRGTANEKRAGLEVSSSVEEVVGG